jgi:hypothetical protein
MTGIHDGNHLDRGGGVRESGLARDGPKYGLDE